jgi:hypothetical protein
MMCQALVRQAAPHKGRPATHPTTANAKPKPPSVQIHFFMCLSGMRSRENLNKLITLGLILHEQEETGRLTYTYMYLHTFTYTYTTYIHQHILTYIGIYLHYLHTLRAEIKLLGNSIALAKHSA